MQVKVFPTGGRQPYIAALLAPPQFSSLAFGGFSTATIPAARVKGIDLRRHLLDADIEIWGDRGPCWGGTVSDTDSDGTLHCIGPQQRMGMYPIVAMGPSTDHSAFIDGVKSYIPAFLSTDMSYVQNNPLTYANPVTTNAGNVASVVADIIKYDSWEWYWAFRQIGGVWKRVPVYEPASVTPDYIITLSAEDAAAFMGDSLTGMTSRVITEWANGTMVTTSQDTDPSHYLVQIGRDVTTWQSSPNTQSAVDAALISNAELVKKHKIKAGRTKGKHAHWKYKTRYSVGAGSYLFKTSTAATKAAKGAGARVTNAVNAADLLGVQSRATGLMGSRRDGSEKTSRIQLASGLPAYLPNVRAGALARVVGLPDGCIDLRIAGVSVVGDFSISVDLGADSGRLDSLLARVG